MPRSIRGRQWSIDALLIDGWFGNGTRFDVLLDILSKIQPIELLLQYCHHFIDPEIPSGPT